MNNRVQKSTICGKSALRRPTGSELGRRVLARVPSPRVSGGLYRSSPGDGRVRVGEGPT